VTSTPGTTATGSTSATVSGATAYVSPPVVDVSEVVAAAVLAVPGVAALHGGAFGQVASYLPGRSVTGVRVRADVTDVHVVLFWGSPVLATADRIRAAVQPLVSTISARVDITVDDVVGPVADTSPG
jgi:uncharacterized alkaline shock family protein YloU